MLIKIKGWEQRRIFTKRRRTLSLFIHYQIGFFQENHENDLLMDREPRQENWPGFFSAGSFKTGEGQLAPNDGKK